MTKFTPTRLLLVAALLCTTSYFLDVSLTAVAPWRDIISAVTSLVGIEHCRGHGMTETSVAATFASTTDQDEPDLLPNVDDPDAVDAQTVCPGYTASNVVRTAHGFNATLTLAGSACNAYGTDIEKLLLTVDFQTASRLSVNIRPSNITPENQTQYILPAELVELPRHGQPTDDGNECDLQFTWTNEPTFSFTVLRRSTEDILFTTAGSKLVYENQFIEFVTILPENYNLYGLEERLHGLRLGNDFVSTMWAADALNRFDYNSYGQHPFYLDTRYYKVDNQTGRRTLSAEKYNRNDQYVAESHGVYLRSAHGLEAVLNPANLTWRALGGSIDLYFYAGPSQAAVTSQYVHSIGLPAMHQYWSLGYHQSRWGYKNWTMLKDVVADFKKAEIPLETIWTDIDYMFQYRDFQNDPNTFAYDEGQRFLAELHANNQHYIPIVDSAIYIPNPHNASDNYSVYDTGHERNVFVKNPDGSEYIGQVWTGYTVFPDWLNHNTTGWWIDNFKDYLQKISWDGIWIDMSEVSSFCSGSCGSGKLVDNPVVPAFLEDAVPFLDYPEDATMSSATPDMVAPRDATPMAPLRPSTTTSYLRTTPTPGIRSVVYPPYVLKNVNGALGGHALSPNATYADGTQEYDIHSTFGHRILAATYAALSTVMPSKRPFIIGRSTFAGSGRYAGHWGGDNRSKWWSMYTSIPQALSMSLFGIPMFGPDVCGFAGHTSPELCARWMALGAMFPFMRNHNGLEYIDQEPYRWPDVAHASRKALAIRYRLLPYYYTLLQRAHQRGDTVMRALAWEFPHPALADADRQFLLGPAVMVTPVLTPGARTVDGVFPGNGPWYDWFSHEVVQAEPWANVTLDAPLTHLPLHIRGGHVLALQEARMTTKECRNTDWSLLVALDWDGRAKGELYLDDGESVEPAETLDVRFTVRDGALYVTGRGAFTDGNALADITVLGVSEEPKSVTLDGEKVDWNYDQSIKRLRVGGLQAATKRGAWTKDWTVSWV